jgi:serine/threonine protein kinase
MRERGGRFVLLDFGSVTEPGAFFANSTGTPLAMAPELFGDAAPSRTSDIYALGVLLYRLVSARYPVEGRTPAEIATRHAQHAGTPLRDLRPDLPGDFVRVVERSLDPDPGRRYLSAGAMERALAISLGSMTPSEIHRLPRPATAAEPAGARVGSAPPETHPPSSGPEHPAGPLALVLWIGAGALIGAALLFLAQRIWG